MKFVAKTKRSEAKYNLEAIYKCEIAWYGEYDSFAPSFATIRWKPEGTIYYYTFSVDPSGTELYGKGLAAPGGMTVAPGASTSSFTACAWGNIDNDLAVDVWYTNDRKDLLIAAGFDDV
jgi:hypothetical protein